MAWGKQSIARRGYERINDILGTMKRALLLTICFVTIAAPMLANAQTKPAKPKDTLDPKCEQKEKVAMSDCRERRLQGAALKQCLDKAKYEAYEVLVMNGKKKKDGHFCEREDKIKDRYGEKCLSECPKGVAVLSRSLVQSGLKVKKCRDEKNEGFVVACRQEEEKKKEDKKEDKKDSFKKTGGETDTKDKAERLKAAEEKVLGDTPHKATHYDCAGMGKATTCYGGDGVIRTQEQRDQKRLRDGDIAIPQSIKSQYGLNYGDKVLLQDPITQKTAWATVRDTNAHETIDFFREYDPNTGGSVRESTPMQQLGFTYRRGVANLRIIQIDRTSRH